jgi:hypothetical protein
MVKPAVTAAALARKVRRGTEAVAFGFERLESLIEFS